ncbi:helix-turn-helix domain-containing protein [Pseudonocardia sp. MCCB 268]|nr:helix-turn-helix domain-containing protein [Pseudonocardia cytotoxica]
MAGPIALTPLEFDLLVALALKPRRCSPARSCSSRSGSYRHAADTRLVNVHVQRLRSGGATRAPGRPDRARGGYKPGPRDGRRSRSRRRDAQRTGQVLRR